MSIYFGTDGIRGVVNKDFTNEVCYKCGNALASICPNAKILIGRDTRVSGSFVSLAFSTGCLIGGANVVDVGVIPTAGISYLVKKLNFDFGVVISASHNPPDHNGIKIFDKNGDKINSSLEDLIEKQFVKNNIELIDVRPITKLQRAINLSKENKHAEAYLIYEELYNKKSNGGHSPPLLFCM